MSTTFFRRALSLLLFIVSIIGITYQLRQSQVTYYAESDAYVDIDIIPSVLLFPSASYDLSWTSERITGIFLNDGGKIGTYQESFAGAICQVHRFRVTFENGEEQSFQVRPFLISHPLIAIPFLFGMIGVVMLAATVNMPIIKHIGNYWLPLLRPRDALFVHRWFALVLFSLGYFVIFLYRSDCMGMPLHDIAGHFNTAHSLLALTGILALMLSISVSIRPTLLQRLQSLLNRIPYAVVVAGVFVYLGVTIKLLIILNTLVDVWICVPIALLLMIIGAVLVHNRMQPSTAPDTIHKAQHLVFIVAMAILWILVYRTNWVAIIHDDLVQTSIGVVLFLLPGALMALIAERDISNWSTLTLKAFLFSFATSSLLWLIVLLFGLSTDVLQWAYVLVGLGALVQLSRRPLPYRLFKLEQDWTIYHTLVLIIGFVALLLIVYVIVEPGLGKVDRDFAHYNPLVTAYAQSPSITLAEPFLGLGNIMLPRLWIVFWAVPQALIVTFSQVHILTSFHLISIHVMIIVFIVMFDVTRRLETPQLFALMSIPIFAFIVSTHLMPFELGMRLFWKVGTDKLVTAFVLAPIAYITTLDYLKNPSRVRLLLTVLAVMNMMMGHPTIYFLGCVILGLMALTYVVFRSRNWRHIIVVALVCGSWMIVPLAIRIIQSSGGYRFLTESAEQLLELNPERSHLLNIDEEASNESNSQQNTNDNVEPEESNPRPSVESTSDENIEPEPEITFSGINPDLLNREVYQVLIIGFILSLVYFRTSDLLYIVLPSGVLLLAALNPIMAGILGWVITYSQLWRIPWVVPFGVIGAVTLWLIYRVVHSYLRVPIQALHAVVTLSAMYLAIMTLQQVSTPLNFNIYDNLNRKAIYQRDHANTDVWLEYNGLVEIAEYIQSQTTDNVHILASEDLVNQIPAMGDNIYGITWYTASTPNVPRDEFASRNRDHRFLFSSDLTLIRFKRAVDRQNIDYIILNKEFEQLEKIMKRSELVDDTVLQFGTLRLWKIIAPE